MADKSVKFNTSLSAMISEKMNTHAQKTGLTKSSIVSQALVDYFQKNELMDNSIGMMLEMIKGNPELMKSITTEKK